MQGVVEQAEQAGFARPISADQTDFFAGVDDAGGAIEQDLHTAAKNNIFEGNHDKGKAIGDGPRPRGAGWCLTENGVSARVHGTALR
jgi:hypothetical protein